MVQAFQLLTSRYRFSTAIIMEIGYGHQIVSNDDPYLKMADDASRATAESGPIGGTPVDLFPICMLLLTTYIAVTDIHCHRHALQ